MAKMSGSLVHVYSLAQVAGQDLKREDLFEVLVDRPLPKGVFQNYFRFPYIGISVNFSLFFF